MNLKLTKMKTEIKIQTLKKNKKEDIDINNEIDCLLYYCNEIRNI